MDIASHQDWSALAGPHHSLGSSLALVDLTHCADRIKHVLLLQIPVSMPQLPQLKSAVLADRGEDSRFVGAPLDVDDLIGQVETLEGVERSVFAPVPQLAAPVSGASQEDVVQEGVGSNLVDRSVVPRVYLQVLLRVALGAAIDDTFFSGGKIHGALSLEELEGEAACESKVHVFSTVLLVGLGNPPQQHQISILQSLLHRPLSDAAISRYTNQTLTLVALALADPLDVPYCVGVLIEGLLVLSYGDVVLLADVVDEDDTVVSAACDEVGVLHAELAGCYLGVGVEYLLGESGVLEGPEHQQALAFVGVLVLVGELVGDTEQVVVDGVPVGSSD